MTKSKELSDAFQPSGPTVARGWGSFHRQMEDAYIAYWRSLRDVQVEAIERAEEARGKLLRTIQEMQLGAERQWRDAYADYLRAAQDLQREFGHAQRTYSSAGSASSAAAPDESYQALLKRAEEAYRASGEAVNEALSRDMPARVEELYRAYFETVRDLGVDAQRRARDAYRDHLRAIKNTWSGLDVDAALEGSEVAATH